MTPVLRTDRGVTLPSRLVSFIVIGLSILAGVCLIVVLRLLAPWDAMHSPRRIGIIVGTPVTAPVIDGIKDGMSALGYADGADVLYDVRYANASSTLYQTLTVDLVQEGVSVIVAFPTSAALAAWQAASSSQVPVVFAVMAVEGSPPIDSMQRPGHDLTGVVYQNGLIAVQRIDMLHELVPSAKRVLVAYQSSYPTMPETLTQLRSEAARLGIHLVEEPVSDTARLRERLATHEHSGSADVDAVFTIPDTITQTPDGWGVLRDFSDTHRLPLVGFALPQVYDGALFSISPDLNGTGKLAASDVAAILHGSSAGEVPVEISPTYINLSQSVAQRLGIVIPSAIRSKADLIAY